MTTPQNSNLRPGEAGFILPLVLIIVAIGAMVVIGLLGYASGLLRAGGEDADALKELYAADAGITHVKRLLEQDSLPNEIPSIEVNGLGVTMKVTPVATPGAAVPTPKPQPIDPELPEVPEVHLGKHLVDLHSVPDGTKLDMAWAFTRPAAVPMPATDPPDPNPTYPSLAVYVGRGGGAPIAKRELPDGLKPGKKEWLDLEDIELVDAVSYVVDFDAGTVEDLVSDPFSQDCDSPTEPLFCLTTPAMDYIVVSTAGETTVTAYVRQMPEWTLGFTGGVNYTFSGGEVVTLSWKPYPPDE